MYREMLEIESECKNGNIIVAKGSNRHASIGEAQACLQLFSILLGRCYSVLKTILLIAFNKTIFMPATKFHDFWIENLGNTQISAFVSSTVSLILNFCSLHLQESI